jgi:cysteine sulfinate desulfinase/cysteine desulfurase-like protein
MGLPRELALASVRFSFGWASTMQDVEHALAVIPAAVAQLRPAGKVA